MTKHRVQDRVSEDRSEPEHRQDREEDGSVTPAANAPYLDYILAELCYTVPQAKPLMVRAFPPSSGRKLERPPRERCRMPVYDCRPIAAELTLDGAGFELRAHRSAFRDFFDESFRHRERHRWYYAPDMQPDEVLFLKCYDSAGDGRACFTGHTGFRNPACPEDFIPRESIEARTLAIFPGG